MTSQSDSTDDPENRSRDRATDPSARGRRRRDAPPRRGERATESSGTAEPSSAWPRAASGREAGRSPEWPYAPSGKRSSEWPSTPAGGWEERSPEWPYAPTDGREGRSAPETSQERLPRWGLQASPDVDVAEHPDEVHVWCDLPGCAEETIELSGDEWTLYVSAERAEEYCEDGGIQRRERSRHAERSISLPARCEVDEAEASFEDGVLFVRTPKHESERSRTIGFE